MSLHADNLKSRPALQSESDQTPAELDVVSFRSARAQWRARPGEGR